MNVLGIDPGWSGGIALLDEAGATLGVDSFANKTEAAFWQRTLRRLVEGDGPSMMVHGRASEGD